MLRIERTSEVSAPELDSNAKRVLDFWQSKAPRPIQNVPLHEARNSGLITPEITGDSVELHLIEDRTIRGEDGFDIPIRIYRPNADLTGPVLIYAHGGGWTLLSVNSCVVFLRELATQVECFVVSVDYRLSPENPFPIPFNDCWNVLEWVKESGLGFAPSQIAVGGDSAGGNIAAAMSIKSRDMADSSINFQILLYPACSVDLQTSSMRELGPDPRFRLSAGAMNYFWSNYLDGQMDNQNPYAVPSRSKSLAGVAPALIVVAGFDPLRSDGENYAKQLDKDGIQTELLVASTLPHGFVFTLGAVPEARRVTEIIFSKIKEALRQNIYRGESK